MLTQPRAILFDLDDTILSFGGREQLLVQVAQEFSAELAPMSPEDVGALLEAASSRFWNRPEAYPVWRSRLLEARTTLIEREFAAWSSRVPGATAEVARRFAGRFHEIRESSETRLFPGAVQTLQELRARSVRLALVTNGHADSQRAKVERFSLSCLFDHVQIEGEVGFGKPENRAYLHAMGALGVTAKQTWMVGDHLEWEVAAPQRLGIFAVWHDHTGKGLPVGCSVFPDLTVHRISDLLPLIAAPEI